MWLALKDVLVISANTPSSKPALPALVLCTSPCRTPGCAQRATHDDLHSGRERVHLIDLRCIAFVRDPAPGPMLREAVFVAMEEAEMFGDLDAAGRALAVAWVNHLPVPLVAAIGRAFLKALKEMQ